MCRLGATRMVPLGDHPGPPTDKVRGGAMACRLREVVSALG
jgi:hypothetical protein